VGSVKLSAAFAHLAMNALLARLLTPASMGLFLLITSITTFAGIIGQFGLNQTVVRTLSYARGKNDASQAKSTVIDVMLLGMLISLAVAVALYFGIGSWLVLAEFDSPEVLALVPYLALWTFLIALHSLLAETLRGLDRVVLAAFFDSTRPLTPALAVSAVLLVHWLNGDSLSLLAIVVLAIGCYGLGICCSAALVWKFFPTSSSPYRPGRRELLAAAWPLLIHQATWIGISYSTLWMLAFFGTKQEVAYYGTAFLLIQIVAFPMVVMYATLSPKLAELHIQNKITPMGELLRKSATVIAVPSLIVLAMMMVYGDWLLSTIFGAPYVAAYPILLTFGLGQIFNLWAGSAAHALAMTGNQKLLMYATVLSGLVTVLAAVFLVRPYGAPGVAAAYSMGLACHTVTTIFAVKARLGIWPQMYILGGPRRA